LEKIADNIFAFRLGLPFPMTPELTVYYLDGETPAIIDSGLGDPQAMGDVAKHLSRMKKTTGDLSFIINTHEHVEHFGGNRKIKALSGARVLASEAAAPFIENLHDHTRELRDKLTRSHVRMAEMIQMFLDFHMTIDESPVDQTLKDGDLIDLGAVTLQVIATPGHADGHICLYDAGRKVLFTGDHVISTGSTFVGYGWRELATGSIMDIFEKDRDRLPNISAYMASIKKIQTLDLALILPAHGPPVTDPYVKLEQEIAHKKERIDLCLDIMKKKREAVLDDLAATVYEEKQSNWLQQGAVLGYLEVLSRAGEISAHLEDDNLCIRVMD